MKINRILHNSLALLVPLLLVVILYGPILTNPSDYFFSDSGDGIKNYYALAWFVEHNVSWTNHTGMNYPYGEHYIYTDGFVPLGWILKAIGANGVQSIGVANSLMLLSLVFGSFFLFRILRCYKVPVVFAILASSAIAILNPQVIRMGGHFSLSLMFFFPLTLWMFIRFKQNMSSWLWTSLIALSILFWLFMHPYLGVILLLFLLCVWLIIIIMDRKILSNVVVLIQMLTQTVIPLLVFKMFTLITDYHINRPYKPSGFWESSSSLKSILLPIKGPMSFVTEWFDISKISWEGRSYIGLAAILFVIYYFVHSIINGQNLRNKIKPKERFEIFLIPSILVLIFSFGIPFYQFPILAEILSPVRNFRALGRFAWPFFYIITLFSVIKLYQWSVLIQGRKRIFQLSLVVLIGIMFFEGIGQHISFAKKVVQNKNTFKYSNLSEDMKNMMEHGKRRSYLSILPMPFYHLGSERYSILAFGDGLYNSMILSYHTGLPILSNLLPRTSLNETKKSIMTVSPIYYKKEICQEIPQGELLIIHSKGVLKEAEERYLQDSKELMSGDVGLRSIKTEAICEVKTSVGMVDSLFDNRGSLYFPIGSKNYLEYFNFKDNDSKGRIFNEKNTTIKDFAPGEISEGIYEVTIWYKNPEEVSPNDAFFLEVKNEDGSGDSWKSYRTLDKAAMFSGDSLIFTRKIEIKNVNKRYKIMIEKYKTDPVNLIYLNMLIRKMDQDVYIKNGDSVSVNNHPLILLE